MIISGDKFDERLIKNILDKKKIKREKIWIYSKIIFLNKIIGISMLI